MESWKPSRLLQIDSSQKVVYLIETRHRPVYMTLSHCWGKKSTFKLTKTSQSDLKGGIPITRLPQTYADAVKIVVMLGVDYIWIDSLCILQDSKEDWDKEAAQMSMVYQNSFCNIAALDAEDSHSGIFAARDPSILEPLIITSKWVNTPPLRWSTKHRRIDADSSFVIDSSLIHQRAWVLQERMLAPRTLHFGRKQLYWECRESIASETLPMKSHPSWWNGPFVVMPTSTTTNPENILSLWNSLVRKYSHCNLTYITDKLVAVSGLGKEIRKALTLCTQGTSLDTMYLAGLWRFRLESQLLWTRSVQTPLKPRPKEYIAPTWSWASVDSGVETHPVTQENKISVHLAVVKAATISSPINDEFVRVSEGELQVEAALWELVSLDRKEHRLQIRLDWDIDDTALATLSATLFLMPVVLELGTDTPEEALSLGVFRGLVLRATRQRNFERVGRFDVVLFKDRVTSANFDHLQGNRRGCIQFLGVSLHEQGNISLRHHVSPTGPVEKQVECLLEVFSIVLV